MLSRAVRILNFDNSVTRQKELLRRFQPVVFDLTKTGPSSRLWLDEKDARPIRDILTPEFKNAITFLGSGDFHHISSLLIGQFTQPLTVILFDHHPDWDILPPRWGCGSWLTETLKKANVKKAVMLGVSSNDIDSFSVQTGNLGSLKANRVEIYPYRHRPTLTLLKKVPRDNVSVRVEKGFFYDRIFWRELKDANLRDFFFDLLKRIEVKQTYVSIDKDCLTAAHSLTNWEEGSFGLEEVLLLLKLIKENLDIVGLDITGEYSFPETRGRLKTFFSRLDHPAAYSARSLPGSTIDSTNEQTNIRILESLRY